MFDKLFHGFEKTLAAVLLFLIAVVTTVAAVDLCWVLYIDLTSDRGLPLTLEEMFELFGLFLIVLIAIELMASIYMYLKDKSVHVEMMLLIGVTALTRKVVVLEPDTKDPLYLLGLAALLGTLIGGYYLVRRVDLKATDRALEHTPNSADQSGEPAKRPR